MSLYLRGHSRDISYEKVHEVRVAIETEMAAHAARRATHVGVAHLREQHEHIGELLAAGESIAAADLEFHRELARIADNTLFLVVLDSIVDLLFDVRHATLLLPEAPSSPTRCTARSSKPSPTGTRKAPAWPCGITSMSCSISGCDRRTLSPAGEAKPAS